jgi:hypothetical protein
MRRGAIAAVLLVPCAFAQFAQQGGKLVATDAIGAAYQGRSVAISADGQTAIVSGSRDNTDVGAAWVYTRRNGVWAEAAKLVGAAPYKSPNQALVGISADGSTAVITSYQATTWTFVRNAQGVWQQQGDPFSTSDYPVAATAVSADANTLAITNIPFDASFPSFVSIYTRSNGSWRYSASGVGGLGPYYWVAVSGDGSTVLASSAVFTRTGTTWPQQVTLPGAGATALSYDGNTALLGTDVFTRSNGVWSRQGVLTVNDSMMGEQGSAVALSADGNIALVGGSINMTVGSKGAAWIFSRVSGAWVQQPGRISGSDATGANLSYYDSYDSVALSAGGSMAIVGDGLDNNFTGAAWVFSVASSPIVVNPTAPAGVAQAITFTFNDPRGYQHIGIANILINSALDGGHACYLAYTQPLNTLYLVSDDGTAIGSGAVLSSSGSLSNSQCTVSWSAIAVSRSGTTLSLNLSMSFRASFAGGKVIYLAARDLTGNNSGWQTMGVCQIPSAASMTLVTGMTPASGSGGSPAPYTFSFSDSKGYQDLGIMNTLVNSALDGRHACYLAYVRASNTLYLVNDAGDALRPGQSLSTGGSLGNSQCTVAWGPAPVAASDNDLTLSLFLTFSHSFAGTRIFYLAARDANDLNNTGWQPSGIRIVQ